MRLLFNLFFALALPLILPFKWRKFCRRHGDKSQFKNFLGFYDCMPQEKKLTWVHAVSVGETQVALGLIRAMLAKNPNEKILLTTTTPTGQAIARAQSPRSVTCCYAPLDFAPFIKRFLNHFSPQKLIILETEIWPNIITLTAKRNIPIYIVNGRLSDKSSRSYARFSWLFAPLLKKVNRICVQTQQDAERFYKISEDLNVVITGNMKLDQSIPMDLKKIDLSAYFGNEPFITLVAASTHPGEEAYIVAEFCELKKQFPHLKLVSVPRHAERGDDVERILKQTPYSYARISTHYRSVDGNVEMLLSDTTGVLLNYLAAADLVIIGKTLLHYTESQNPIEAVLLKKPIFSGAQMTNFRFIFDELMRHDGITIVKHDLAEKITYALNNPEKMQEQAERAFVALQQHQGATLTTLTQITPQPA